MIYMQSPDKQPDSAIKLCEALRKIDVDVPLLCVLAWVRRRRLFSWAKALNCPQSK